MKSRILCLVGGIVFSFAALAQEQTSKQETKLDWLTDYSKAYQKAITEKKDLFIAIEDGEKVFKPKENVSKSLKNFILLRIPLDHEVELKGEDKKIKLLEHESFSEFPKQTGLAIINGKDEKDRGLLISVLPSSRWESEFEVSALLDLPRGSLTQRTLVWAIRLRSERPQSTNSGADPGLMAHAASHAQAEANANAQFHNLGPATQFGGNREIVAESWPHNRFVVDAAIDIIEAWTHSPRHWDAVMSPNNGFGYDMKRNSQKWFACGVFK